MEYRPAQKPLKRCANHSQIGNRSRSGQSARGNLLLHDTAADEQWTQGEAEMAGPMAKDFMAKSGRRWQMFRRAGCRRRAYLAE